MLKFSIIGLSFAAFALAACGGADSFRSNATSPTVTYSYKDGGDYDEIKGKADEYCDEEFDREAVLVDRDMEGDRHEATFSCQ